MISGEIRLAALSFLTGVRLMAGYDGFRVLRLFVPHGAFLTGAEDFFYLTYCGISVFAMLYRCGDGAFRAWAVAGAFLGMALYQHLVSQNLLKYLKKAQEYFRIKRKKRQKSKQVKA